MTYLQPPNTFTGARRAIAMLMSILSRFAKFVLVLAAIAMPAGCMHSNVRHPSSRPTMAEQLEDETVALVQLKESDGDVRLRPYCSGVWISQEEILTAAHCTEDLGKSKERLEQEQVAELLGVDLDFPEWDPTGQTAYFAVHEDLKSNNTVHKFYTGTVRVYEPAQDLALIYVGLRSPAPTHTYTQLSTADVRDGDEVNVVGMPRGVMWTYVRGVVGGSRYFNNPMHHTYNVLQVSAPVTFGNSGGGAFDADGNLIGISSYLFQPAPNMSFFVHRDEIKDFLVHNHVRGYR